jgi:hypothetical protein
MVNGLGVLVRILAATPQLALPTSIVALGLRILPPVTVILQTISIVVLSVSPPWWVTTTIVNMLVILQLLLPSAILLSSTTKPPPISASA